MRLIPVGRSGCGVIFRSGASSRSDTGRLALGAPHVQLLDEVDPARTLP
jgi:hypothetical protein